MGDRTGDSMAGLTGELMGELGGDESGILTGGAAAVRVGEGAGGPWTGTGEGHSGLLAVGEGDGVVLSGLKSSGMNGSGKKRAPGEFTRVILKRNREDPDLV